MTILDSHTGQSSFGNPLNLGSQTMNSLPVLNLEKNQVLDLNKVAPMLRKCVLGAGWDVNQLGGPAFDLDIAAFLLDNTGKVDRTRLNERVVYFNNMAVFGARLEGDNRTGEGEGDDERIQLDLSQIDPAVCKIVFVVTIHEAQMRRQTFGMVNNSYVRLLNTENGEREILRYPLKGNYNDYTSIVFCELSRNMGGWEFKAVGDGVMGDLNTLLMRYL